MLVPCSSSMRVVMPVATMVRSASMEAYVQKMCSSSLEEVRDPGGDERRVAGANRVGLPVDVRHR